MRLEGDILDPFFPISPLSSDYLWQFGEVLMKDGAAERDLDGDTISGGGRSPAHPLCKPSGGGSGVTMGGAGSSGRRMWWRRRPTTARFGGGWRCHRARPLSTASGRGRRLIGEVSRGGATSPATA
uniref:Uncharacterized protein n=1 Tax=Arundo donax TaxID=35708 RepID=A0A0A9EPL3_ARUDO